MNLVSAIPNPRYKFFSRFFSLLVQCVVRSFKSAAEPATTARTQSLRQSIPVRPERTGILPSFDCKTQNPKPIRLMDCCSSSLFIVPFLTNSHTLSLALPTGYQGDGSDRDANYQQTRLEKEHHQAPKPPAPRFATETSTH